MYFLGIIGINNIKANDYSNVILMALAHVEPLRDFFLLNSDIQAMPSNPKTGLAVRFGEFVRKIWNMHNFRSHVSPHEILQCVMKVSKNHFQFIKQGEPVDFMSWILNNLIVGLKELNLKVFYIF